MSVTANHDFGARTVVGKKNYNGIFQLPRLTQCLDNPAHVLVEPVYRSGVDLHPATGRGSLGWRHARPVGEVEHR